MKKTISLFPDLDSENIEFFATEDADILEKYGIYDNSRILIFRNKRYITYDGNFQKYFYYKIY